MLPSPGSPDGQIGECASWRSAGGLVAILQSELRRRGRSGRGATPFVQSDRPFLLYYGCDSPPAIRTACHLAGLAACLCTPGRTGCRRAHLTDFSRNSHRAEALYRPDKRWNRLPHTNLSGVSGHNTGRPPPPPLNLETPHIVPQKRCHSVTLVTVDPTPATAAPGNSAWSIPQKCGGRLRCPEAGQR